MRWLTVVLAITIVGGVLTLKDLSCSRSEISIQDSSSLLVSRYPPSSREESRKTLPLIEAYDTTYDSDAYELLYSSEDLYNLKNWVWRPTKNLEITLDKGYLLIGHTPRGATAAVILPQGKLSLFEKRIIGWRKMSLDNLFIRFHPAELSSIFSPAVIESSEDLQRFSEAAGVIQHKVRNWCCSWTKGIGWRVLIPEPAKYAIDVDTTQGTRLGWWVKNNKGVKIPLFRQPLSAPDFRDLKINPSQAKENFRILWESFDRTYPSFEVKKVDWIALKEEYEPMALQATTVGDFLNSILEMLSQLKDDHIWIETPEGSWDTYEPESDPNYNFKALYKYLAPLKQIGSTILLGRTSDNIIYIAFTTWRPDSREDVEELRRNFSDIVGARGIIIDVRPNPGGSEPIAMSIAALFTDRPVVYAKSQYRNGPRHTDLTEPIDRILKPDKKDRHYPKPVLVLIGRDNGSSNESFISAMNQLPQVTLVGDRTAGSSGNPTFINLKLPVKISVSVPQWIDLLPDGTPLMNQGISPDVFITGDDLDFSGDNDPVLEKSLELLRSILGDS